MPLTLVVTASCGPTQRDAETRGTGAIFRSVSTAPCGEIVLGAPFDPSGRATRVDDSTFRLERRCFAGAQSVLVFVRSGRVSAAYFRYPPDQTYESSVASYTEMLGEPRGREEVAGRSRRTFWNDGETRFEVAEQSGASGTVLFTRMTDIRKPPP